MFTGIIEEIGSVNEIKRTVKGARLSVQCKIILDDTQVGDSIAVNGVCVTVTEKKETCFSADLSRETMEKSTFSKLTRSDSVNLERALTLSSRLGGHLVLGHVDCTGTIAGLQQEQDSVVISFRIDPFYMKYIAYKGSVAIDGVSLTIADCEDARFSVAVIPHTLEQTVLKKKRIGDQVNVECDVLSKYVERLINFQEDKNRPSSRLTLESLKEMGF
ncbi:MAG: riboflavin synthase [Spirochaetales bacterium]|nr:riboflavin synthase [Spirochaetales bacterium]